VIFLIAFAFDRGLTSLLMSVNNGLETDLFEKTTKSGRLSNTGYCMVILFAKCKFLISKRALTFGAKNAGAQSASLSCRLFQSNRQALPIYYLMLAVCLNVLNTDGGGKLIHLRD